MGGNVEGRTVSRLLFHIHAPVLVLKCFLRIRNESFPQRGGAEPPQEADVSCDRLLLIFQTITQKGEIIGNQRPAVLPAFPFIWILYIGTIEKVGYYNREQMELMR